MVTIWQIEKKSFFYKSYCSFKWKENTPMWTNSIQVSEEDSQQLDNEALAASIS